MRLDEMIIKANADGKTYFNLNDNTNYSAVSGFSNKIASERALAWVDDWEELPKRHLTVSEAEKELDCEIDTPDISKLFISAKEPPNNYRTVIVFFDYCSNFSKGYYDGKWNYLRGNDWLPCEKPVFWIDRQT